MVLTGVERGAPGPARVLLDRFGEDWDYVTRVCPFEICHGDLHMANVLIRTPAPLLSPAVLIDLEPCLMPWAFDAVYCQVLNSDPGRPGWRGLVHTMAERRRAYGMPVVRDRDGIERLQAIVLGWFALRMWGMLGPAPDPSWRHPAVWYAANRSYIRAAARTSGRRVTAVDGGAR